VMNTQIDVSISNQKMQLRIDGALVREYCISTAKNGPGELQDSECTPRGRHRIYGKYGQHAPVNSVFVARRWTREICSPALQEKGEGRDWILTRIIRLQGCETGRNQGGNVDSFRRYIYIHGTPDNTVLGIPGSRGCIRMRNMDIEDLFDRVPLGAVVNIHS